MLWGCLKHKSKGWRLGVGGRGGNGEPRIGRGVGIFINFFKKIFLHVLKKSVFLTKFLARFDIERYKSPLFVTCLPMSYDRLYLHEPQNDMIISVVLCSLAVSPRFS